MVCGLAHGPLEDTPSPFCMAEDSPLQVSSDPGVCQGATKGLFCMSGSSSMAISLPTGACTLQECRMNSVHDYTRGNSDVMTGAALQLVTRAEALAEEHDCSSPAFFIGPPSARGAIPAVAAV